MKTQIDEADVTVNGETTHIAIGFSYSDRYGQTCEACGQYKLNGEFRFRDKRSPYANLLRPRCKQCEKEKRPTYQTLMRRKGYRLI